MTTEARADYDPFAWFYDGYWCRGVVPDFLRALDQLLLPQLPDGSAVLDLCCGTGRVAAGLVARGFRVTGLDISEEMLSYARRNAPEAEFVRADARSFALPPVFGAVVSTFDSLNHFLRMEELSAVFRNVRAALRPGGLFFFDVNLEMGFREHWQEHYSVIEEERVCLVRGTYDSASKLGRYDFTLFRQSDGCWRRSDFSISERCHPKGEIRAALKREGFRPVTFFDAVADAGLTRHRGRVFVLAEKHEEFVH
jgi:SAM-dependent methyltransferase